MLRDIYQVWARHSARFGEGPVNSVETLWESYEQPLFILGFSLHPGFVNDAKGLLQSRDTSITSVDRVCDFAVYYYRRFIGDDISGLREEMETWLNGELTESKIEDLNGIESHFWYLQCVRLPHSKLAVLAVRILSIVVNTTTCEEHFGQQGDLGIGSAPCKIFQIREYTHEQERIKQIDEQHLHQVVDPRELALKSAAGRRKGRVSSRQIVAEREEELFRKLSMDDLSDGMVCPLETLLYAAEDLLDEEQCDTIKAGYTLPHFFIGGYDDYNVGHRP